MFYGSSYTDVIRVIPIELGDFHQYPVAGFIVAHGIGKPYIAQLPQGNVNVDTKQIHENAIWNDGHDSRFAAESFVDPVCAVTGLIQVVMPALRGHSILPAADCQTGIAVNAFDNIIDFRSESLGKQVMVDFIGILSP